MPNAVTHPSPLMEPALNPPLQNTLLLFQTFPTASSCISSLVAMRFSFAPIVFCLCLGPLARLSLGLSLPDAPPTAELPTRDQGGKLSATHQHTLARRVAPAESKGSEAPELKRPRAWKAWIRTKIKSIAQKRHPDTLERPEALTEAPAPGGGHVRLREWEEKPHRQHDRAPRKTQSQRDLKRASGSQSVLFQSQEIRPVEVRRPRPTLPRLDKLGEWRRLQKSKQREDNLSQRGSVETTSKRERSLSGNIIQSNSRANSLASGAGRATKPGLNRAGASSDVAHHHSLTKWKNSRRPSYAPSTLDNSADGLGRQLFYSPSERPSMKRPSNEETLHQQPWV